jgi:hypothetical protein
MSVVLIEVEPSRFVRIVHPAPLMMVAEPSCCVITPSGQVNLVCHGKVAAGALAKFQQSGFPAGLDPLEQRRIHI